LSSSILIPSLLRRGLSRPKRNGTATQREGEVSTTWLGWVGLDIPRHQRLTTGKPSRAGDFFLGLIEFLFIIALREISGPFLFLLYRLLVCNGKLRMEVVLSEDQV
jgi:hypothetical protein